MRNFSEKIAHWMILLIVLFIGTGTVFSQQIAFPGAEGYAKYASGGRGGEVLAVTNLLDEPDEPPEGSLRWVLKQFIDTIPHPTIPGVTLKIPRPLTVVFRVSGTIELKDELKVGRENLTLAGQTAPGDGICFKNHCVTVRGENIIIRYLRFRPGLDAGADALSHGIAGLNVENCSNVIVDHCSFSWANEECAIFYDNQNTTVQWCIASEGLYSAGHAKGSRSYCGVWGGQNASYHHNLIAHNRSRTIRFNGARAHDTYALVDYRNNVIYNWGTDGACYGGEVQIQGGFSRANIIGNYYKPGPAVDFTLKFIEPSYGSTDYGVGQWYVDGNYMYSDPDKTSDNWSGVDLGRIPSGSRDLAKSTKPFRIEEPLPTESAEDAYQSVIEMVGAVYPRRDTVDARIIHETLSGTATGNGVYGGNSVTGIIDTPDSVGGYPEYLTYDVPEDADEDGMDDAWEQANGLSPADPEDRNEVDQSGYTMLEVYLNSLVEDFTQILDPVVHVKNVHDAYCIGSEPSSMVGSPRGGHFEEGTALTVFGDSVVFDPADTGDYVLKYVYSDGEGFADSVTEILTVHPLPEASITGLDTAYRVGDIDALYGEPSGGAFVSGTDLIPKIGSEAVFMPKSTGTYEIFYWYTDEFGCTVTVSAKTTVYPATGSGPEPSGMGIRVYPNPAGDRVRIVSPDPLLRVIIYNLSGSRIKGILLPATENIPVGEFESGIYYMHITTEKGTFIRKFVKM